MPGTILEWTTSFPTAANVKATDQPALVDGTHAARASHYNTLADLADSLAGLVGDDTLPATSIRRRVENRYYLSDYDSLAAAVTAIGATECELLIDADATVDGNLTVPATTTLRRRSGYALTIATGVTLTIAGNLEASPRQLFILEGTGAVSFTSLRDVKVEWWETGTSDYAAAITAALASLATKGRVHLRSRATYPVLSAVTIPASKGLRLGHSTIALATAGQLVFSGSLCSLVGDGRESVISCSVADYAISVEGCSVGKFADFFVDCSVGGKGISLTATAGAACQSHRFTRVQVAGPGATEAGSIGVYLGDEVSGNGVYFSHFHNCVVSDLEKGWLIEATANGHEIFDVVMNQCTDCFDIEGTQNRIIGGFAYSNSGSEGSERCIFRFRDTAWANMVLGFATEPGTYCYPYHLAASAGEAGNNVIFMIDNTSLGGSDSAYETTIITQGLCQIGRGKTYLSGDSTVISRHISATDSWTPGEIAAGATAGKDVTVTGAALGDSVAIGYTQDLADGLVIAGHVKASDTVRVTITNTTGGALTPTAGDVRADVWQHTPHA
jgi:hypothetical protein